MPHTYWVAPLPPLHVTDGTAYTGSTALGDITPAPPPVIAGGTFEVGSRLEFAAFGRYTSTGTPGTIIMGMYLGTGAIAAGQAIAVTSTLTLPASQTNRSWRLEGNASVRTIGSGTQASIIGLFEISNLTGTAPVVGTDLAPATAPAVLTFDSTINNTIRLGVTPSVTTGSWQCHYFGVRSVN